MSDALASLILFKASSPWRDPHQEPGPFSLELSSQGRHSGASWPQSRAFQASEAAAMPSTAGCEGGPDILSIALATQLRR